MITMGISDCNFARTVVSPSCCSKYIWLSDWDQGVIGLLVGSIQHISIKYCAVWEFHVEPEYLL